jgi:hypothetical protein
LELGLMLRVPVPWPRPIAALHQWLSPFRSLNSYGLFAVMTTTRDEIVVEGSQNGKEWLAYEFKYKPGDLKRRPQFVAPHQPRLDWQMWFAALSSVEQNPWLMNFCVRLLQGRQEVLRLVKTNPFAEAPPRYIRAMVYRYRFTDGKTRKRTGQWWERQLRGQYMPPITWREDLALGNDPSATLLSALVPEKLFFDDDPQWDVGEEHYGGEFNHGTRPPVDSGLPRTVAGAGQATH